MKKLRFVVVLMVVVMLVFSYACKKKPTAAEPLVDPTATPNIDATDYGFETGTMNWADVYGAVKTAESSAEFARCGSKSLKFNCEFSMSAANGNDGINLSAPANLEGKTIEAYIYAPAGIPAGIKGTVYIKTTSTYIYSRGAEAALTAGAWTKVTLVVDTPAYSSGTEDNTDVKQIGVALSYTGTWTGAVYIDCVDIIDPMAGSPTNSPTTPPTTTYTLTPVGAVTPSIPEDSLYGFEIDNEGFVKAGQVAGIITSTARAYRGVQSLEMQCAFKLNSSGGSVVKDLSTPLDLTDKILAANIWVPANVPSGSGVYIYVKSTAGLVYENGQWLNVSPGVWNTIYFDPNNPGYTGGSPDRSDIRQIGIALVPTGGWTGSFYANCYVDSIYVSASPATATPTQPATNTPVGPTFTPTDTALPTTNAPTDSNIQYFGRWDKSDPSNYRASWGPVYIKANFTGTSCVIKLTDSNYLNNYQYSIDGGEFVQMLATTQTAYTIASGLMDTSHSLLFVRRTDGTFGVTNFKGFEAVQGESFTLTAPDSLPARKIEFIGDSITCGSGNEGTGGNSRYNENGYLAFGPVAARSLDAEWSVVSRGGLGAFRNWNEAKPPTQKHAEDYYLQTLYYADESLSYPLWDFNTWIPDAVVIALGVNDFGASPVAATIAEFQPAYEEMISLIRSRYPSAHIFCMEAVPQWTSANCDTAINNAVAVFNGAGDANVHVLQVNDAGILLSTEDYIGDATHPNVAGHEKIADKIDNQIATVMGWPMD